MGKTTFLSSLLEIDLKAAAAANGIADSHDGIQSHGHHPYHQPANQAEIDAADKAKAISIDVISIDKEFYGAKVALRLLDVENFGDNITNEDSFRVLLSYIEEQFKAVLEEEQRIRRNPKFEDNRVHALLYFIAPTGHGLHALDIEAMRVLGRRVNVIPVLAKADGYAEDELARMKAAVLEQIRANQISIFDFSAAAASANGSASSSGCTDPSADASPTTPGSTMAYLTYGRSNSSATSPRDVAMEAENDAEWMALGEKMQALVPFAVIGSDPMFIHPGHQQQGQPGRQYPWGFVPANDDSISDLSSLRMALLGSHLEEMRDRTEDVLYEAYRTEVLSKA